MFEVIAPAVAAEHARALRAQADEHRLHVAAGGDLSTRTVRHLVAAAEGVSSRLSLRLSARREAAAAVAAPCTTC